MEVKTLQKYLGMTVHFIYYHHHRLNNEKVFEDDYWEHLLKTGTLEYWEMLYKCLDFALTKDNYCLSIVDSPFKERYSEADIKLFFEKFHVYLKAHLQIKFDGLTQ